MQILQKVSGLKFSSVKKTKQKNQQKKPKPNQTKTKPKMFSWEKSRRCQGKRVLLTSAVCLQAAKEERA